MSDELKDLLHQALPPAADVDPAPIVALARRRRRRRRTTIATVTLVAVAGLGLSLAQGDETEQSGLPAVVLEPSGPQGAYEVAACPDALPELDDANLVVPDLDSVVAVRFCQDLETFGGGPPSGFSDGLVEVERLVQHTADLPPYDPESCATVSIMNTRSSLLFVDADGTQTLVATPYCQDARVDGRAVGAAALLDAYRDALAEQRVALGYLRPFRGDLDCGSVGVSGPAQPGVEDLVAAVACTPSQDRAGRGGTALDADRLDQLRTAWASPGPVTQHDNELGENNCTELDDRPATILAGTDRGDIIRLFASPCGYYVWSDGPGRRAAIEVTP